MLRYTTYIKKDVGFYFIVVYCIILHLNEYNIYIK